MRRVESQDLKQIGLEILKYIDEICKKNNIKYFLGFGTLLGAVRHRGFIPWDDDVDICMLRSDYDRFINIMQQQNIYNLISMETDADYYFSFARVSDKKTKLVLDGMREIHNLGVFVDVFPIDTAPPVSEREQWFATYNKYRKQVLCTIPKTAKYSSYSKNAIKQIIKRFPFRIIWGVNNFQKYRIKFQEWIKKYNGTDSHESMISYTPYGMKAIFDSSIFYNTTTLIFENEEFLVPAKYEEYLNIIYGDYMKLPPIEKQVTHHHFTAYYLD